MEKTFYSSKQAAEETGLSIHTLRYYEQIGLIDGIARDKRGYRRYSEADIAWFHIIKYFRSMGLPISELQQFNRVKGSSTTTARREYMEGYREKVVGQIRELEQTLEKIDYKIELFRGLEASEQGENE